MTEIRNEFDVCVIGAGIHGAGVAQAAAVRGWSVLVLEKSHPAAGTSSRSSKLIHGGLRYLESGQVGLVRECLRERELLLRLAPDIVKLRSFHIPIYRTTRRRPWQLRIGLSTYAVLAGLGADARFRSLPRGTWDTLDGLTTENLQCVFQYQDAQTDDAQLTRAVLRSAESLGAVIEAPATFVGAAVGRDKVEVHFEIDGVTHSCTAGVLVNAAGPWALNIAERITPTYGLPPIELVQGAHILVRGRIERGLYYLESPQDGRAVFVMPWQGDTLVGTTETIHAGETDEVRALPEELKYLSEVLKTYFPHYETAESGAIIGSFAGLRVLPAGEGGAFRRSRETVFHVDDDAQPHVLTILGGKLTAYRATAEHVANRIAPTLPARPRRGDTRTLHLDPTD